MLTRIKYSEVLPVGLSEVKVHLRLDHAHEDEYLRPLVLAATGLVEEYLGRSLLSQVWRIIWVKEKPYPPQLSSSGEDISVINLPYPPLREILGVNRLMSTGEKIKIRRHRLEMNHQVPKLFFADVLEPVEVEYETGYGEKPTDIPPAIRQAILMTVTEYYENRESGNTTRNHVSREMLDTYRVMRLP